MKTLIILIAMLSTVGYTFCQELKNIEIIAKGTEGIIAVKKGAQWGFINQSGSFVIPFRDDLVATENMVGKHFPKFQSNRAMIRETRDNIEYFGFIDRTGAIVIPAKYIRATPFTATGHALAFELFKEKIGDNDLLGKPMIRYVYNEVVIDTTGKKIYYINEPVHVLPMKGELPSNTIISSYFISSNLVAVRNEKGTWDIKDITQSN